MAAAEDSGATEQGGVDDLSAQLEKIRLLHTTPKKNIIVVMRPPLSMRKKVRTPRVLELFSGTGSVGKVAREKGWDVVSVDIDPRADINEDIMVWDYMSLTKDFDVVWASPPCTKYSHYQNQHDPHHLRDLGPSNALVMKTIEIINYFEPSYWFIENPQSGCLKEQSFMRDLPYHDVDYCMYGYGARKRTRIWTNYGEFEGKLCDKKCGSYTENPSPRKASGHPELPASLDERHAIPAPLLHDLFAFPDKPKEVEEPKAAEESE